MPETNPQCYHLSASSIASFKACPQRFRLAYREGLRLAKDTDSQRQGTNWHKLHEVYAGEGTDDVRMQRVVECLNDAYAKVPDGITVEDWAIERAILLTSFIGYQWYWSTDPYTVLASEVPFNLPLHLPRTGLPLSMRDVQRVGKIDHIIKWRGSVCALERKSTSRSIDAESDYWEKARKDSQVSMYALAFKDLIASGRMPVGPLPLKEGEAMPTVGATLYDVWHKPTIKPKTLTQADTVAFIASGEYQGQKFEVAKEPVYNGIYSVQPEARCLLVGDTYATVEEGKKGFAIRETVEMYAARLLQDVYTRPSFYFARREIARTESELRDFRKQLFALYQAQKSMADAGSWYENESQCRATFPCAYIPICYGPGADAVCDGKTVPPNFKRIFVDLTVNGEAIETE